MATQVQFILGHWAHARMTRCASTECRHNIREDSLEVMWLHTKKYTIPNFSLSLSLEYSFLKFIPNFVASYMSVLKSRVFSSLHTHHSQNFGTWHICSPTAPNGGDSQEAHSRTCSTGSDFWPFFFCFPCKKLFVCWRIEYIYSAKGDFYRRGSDFLVLSEEGLGWYVGSFFTNEKRQQWLNHAGILRHEEVNAGQVLTVIDCRWL